MARILIAEDDDLIAAVIEKGLHAHGHTTAWVDDGSDALQWALSDRFDLIVLDLGLPGREGFDVLRRLRTERRRTPVIVLTGRPDLGDAESSFGIGADDYMTKPFHVEELAARIAARLRRSRRDETMPLSASGVELDLVTRRATIEGRVVDLTAREFSLLETLMQHPGQVLTRGQIRSRVWSEPDDTGENVINVHIAAIRKKLGDDVIESVRGVGYRFRDTEPLLHREGGSSLAR